MKNVYFIGIGGIGMSALARFFLHEGRNVAGYDRTSTPLTKALESEGACIHYKDNVNNIPADFKEKETLVVYTPAVGNDNSELNFFKSNGNKIVKRAETLGVIASEKELLAVAGTHGKTTTSTILAHLLNAAGNGSSAFLGGISKNYNNNLLLSNSNLLVAEADEYDRSFLQLYPKVAIITSIDADHLDIYGSHEEVKESFRAFVSQIRKGGTLVIKNKLVNNDKPSFAPEFKEKLYTYSFNEQADFYAQNIKVLEGGYFNFDIVTPTGIVSSCTLGVPGWINVENAIAAFAAAWVVGTDVQRMKEVLKSYSGVKRRFDVQLTTPKVTFIDDYAHHPEELKASITSVRGMFPDKKITGIFQPHLFSRTRDFAKEFAESLSLLDELILLDIYPAREKPIDGITSEIIFKNVSIKSKVMSNKEDLLDLIKNKQIEVLVTMGAGDIDTMLEPIKKTLLGE